MIIRSQDKKTIVNLDNLDAICIGGIKDEVVYSHTDNLGTIRLGIYSDGEKAVKALDMIQNAYERHTFFSITYQGGLMSKLEKCNGLEGARDLISSVFQMPQDSEE